MSMNATQVLERLAEEKLLDAAVPEFAHFLQRLEPETGSQMIYAGAACLQAQLNGHICLVLEDRAVQPEWITAARELPGITDELIPEPATWQAMVTESQLAGDGSTLTPLVLEENRLYLHRLWKQEAELAGWIRSRAGGIHPVQHRTVEIVKQFAGERTLFDPVDWQHTAVALAMVKDLIFISGGPGTGKTFTVLNILTALKAAHTGDEALKIALAAPTGKAARRLAESLNAGKNGVPERLRTYLDDFNPEPLTVHKLLGSDYSGSSFRFNADNPLKHDVIVIDEASMLDIHMWVNLIRAVPEHCKVILLGDKDQLASVEAGSILGDICQGENRFSEETAQKLNQLTGMEIPVSEGSPAVNDCQVFLTKSYRFSEKSGIRRLSQAVNASDEKAFFKLLTDKDSGDVLFLDNGNENLRKVVHGFATCKFGELNKAKPSDIMKVVSERQMLCAVRRGRTGVETLNRIAEADIKRTYFDLDPGEWFKNRLVMATQNNAVLKIRNGEIGCCRNNEGESAAEVNFEGEQSMPVPVSRLSTYEPAWAMTIHKSQGSEFRHVAIILPDRHSDLLSRELLYTAVTRARESILVVGKEEVIRKTLNHSITRNSGLKAKVWK